MRPGKLFTAFAVCVLYCAVSLEAGAAGIKAAVIVGVSNYKYINDLSYCAKDARDVYDRTVRMSNARKSNIKLLTEKNATKSKIKLAIRRLGKKVGYGDVFMFFFSGHGTHGTDISPIGDLNGDDEYLCPYNTGYYSNGSINYNSMIRDDELYEWLLPITQRGATVLVLLDSCYSGGALKAGAGSKLANVKVMEGTPAYKSAKSTSFSKDLSGSNFIVMTASDDEELSQEWPWFQNGVFTHLLLRALDGVADDSYVIGSVGNDDYVITANELWHSITVDENDPYHLSSSITNHFDQTPQITGSTNPADLFYLR